MVTSGLYFHVKDIFSANQSTTSLPTLRYWKLSTWSELSFEWSICLTVFLIWLDSHRWTTVAWHDSKRDVVRCLFFAKENMPKRYNTVSFLKFNCCGVYPLQGEVSLMCGRNQTHSSFRMKWNGVPLIFRIPPLHVKQLRLSINMFICRWCPVARQNYVTIANATSQRSTSVWLLTYIILYL